jgi:hypothetical protein
VNDPEWFHEHIAPKLTKLVEDHEQAVVTTRERERKEEEEETKLRQRYRTIMSDVYRNGSRYVCPICDKDPSLAKKRDFSSIDAMRNHCRDKHCKDLYNKG